MIRMRSGSVSIVAVLAVLPLFTACPPPIGEEILNHVRDQQPPVVSIASPVNGDEYTQTQTVSGTASDEGGEIMRLDWLVSGPFGSLTGNSLSADELEADGSFSFSFVTTNFTTDIEVSVTIVDWNGNTETASVSLEYPGSAIPSFSAAAGNKQVSLYWEGIPDAARYTIYYTTDGNTPRAGYGEEIGPLTSAYSEDSPYVLTGLENGAPHAFLLTAESADSQSSWTSGVITAVPLSRFTLSPIVRPEEGRIRIEWPYPSDGYNYIVYRSESEDGPFSNISGSLDTWFFEDSVALDDTVYWYAVSPDISGSTMSYPAPGTVFPFVKTAQRTLAFADTPDNAEDVYVVGDYAYVADRMSLEVMDLSDPAHPVRLADRRIDYGDDQLGPTELYPIEGDLLLAVTNAVELRIYDISTPGYPEEVGTCNIVGSSSNAAAYADGWAYSAVSNYGIYYVSIPPTGSLVQEVDLSANWVSYGMFVHGGKLYLHYKPTGGGDTLIKVYTITTITPEPVLTWDSDISLGTVSVNDMVLYDTGTTLYAYLACHSGGVQMVDLDTGTVLATPAGLDAESYAVALDVKDSILYVLGSTISALDIADPLSPIKLFSTPPASGRLMVAGDYGYTASGFGGVKAYDLSLPPIPVEAGAESEPGLGSENAACRIRGDYAYVAASGASTPPLVIYEIDRSAGTATRIDETAGSGTGRGIAVCGDFAFVHATGAPGEYSFQVWRVSDPTSPELVSSIDMPDYTNNITLYGDHVFIALRNEGFMAVDISDPADPRAISRYDLGTATYGVDIQGGCAYVGSESGGVTVLDITSPASPAYKSGLGSGTVCNLTAGNGVLCAADYDGVSASDRVVVMDLSDQDSPEELAVLNLGGEDIYPNDLRMQGNYLFYASWADGGDQAETGIRVLDVSARNAPFEIKHIDLVTGSPWALDVSGDILCSVENNRFVVYTLR